MKQMTAFLHHTINTNRPDTLPEIAAVRSAVATLATDNPGAIVVRGWADRISVNVTSRGADLLTAVIRSLASKGMLE